MAGDWLKVEVATPDKPEIFYMAEALNLTSDDVFGKCFRVWAWFDAHTLDGKCNGVIVTKMLVDRCAGITGFANAMLKVNWLLDGESGLTIPNFDRHNGETAKQRALSAKRVAKSRAKSNAECNGDGVTLAQPEKRREENIKTTTPPQVSVDELPIPDFIPIELWNEFMAIRKKLKAQNTPLAIKSLINSLTKFKDMGYDPSEIVIKSITNSWKDVFQPKEPPQSKQPDWMRDAL